MKQLEAYQKKRMRTVLYFCLLLGLLSLLVAASYTWFALSHTPRISDMDVSISGQTGLELSADVTAEDDAWNEVLDFAQLVSEDTVLKPATWSESRQAFVTYRYSVDGRAVEGEYEELTDEQNANRSDDYAYYVKGVFFARSQAEVQVSLGDAVEVNGGENAAGTYVIGMPIWNGEAVRHEDGGQGAETAVRLGLRVGKADPETGQWLDDSEFYIYEPNYDKHIDPEITDDQPTPSIDGGDTLTDEAHIIRQTASSWSEADPVLATATIKSLGEFDKNIQLFSLENGEVERIELYIWLEGQDIDCSNLIESAKIIASLNFAADYSGQSGLEVIQ